MARVNKIKALLSFFPFSQTLTFYMINLVFKKSEKKGMRRRRETGVQER